jgi:preprotein translocase subunit SecE
VGKDVSTNPVKWTEDAREFFGDVQVEFKKVTWPTQQQTIAGTVSVVVIVSVITVVLGVFDWMLSVVMSQVLS